MRPRLFAACLGVASAVCFVVAYLNREPNRTVHIDETGNLSSLFERPFDPWEPYLWLGAGIALVLVALAVLMLGRSKGPPPRRVS